MIRTSDSLAIPLGRFTDVAAFDEANRRAWNKLPTDEHRKQFAAALGGHGYRARAADKHARTFKRLFHTEPAASAGVRFLQEDELFAVVTNVAAAGETLAFAAYIAALGLAGITLTDKNLRPTWADMLKRIETGHETEALGAFLSSAYDDEPASEWMIEVRDFLMHRGRLARHHWVGGKHHGTMTVAKLPKAIPGNWLPEVTLHANTLDPACEWLAHCAGTGLPLLADSLG